MPLWSKEVGSSRNLKWTPRVKPSRTPRVKLKLDADAASSETPAAEGDNGAAPAGNAADMMDGVPGMGGRRGAGAGAPPPPKYDPTARGRYAKVLLSSSEFLFIN